MNEQSAKKILFNRSTLFSLKAELMKKQEEVYEKKRLPQHKLENFKPSPAHADKDLDKTEKKSFKEKLKEVDTDELEACRKSKIVLEKKAELYEHLSDRAGNSQLADRFLVDFSTKKQQEPPKSPSPEPVPITIVDNNEDDDSEWMEFTDCLGRTRKCLKSDVEMYKRRDQELFSAIKKDVERDECSVTDDANEKASQVSSEKPLLVQRTEDYLQSLRDKWEQKERELLAKDNDIHYQDLLFDEARIHGVSYYSFSTEETERRRQMDELKRIREETLLAQSDASDKRKKRNELIAARVAAARARQRMRAGLPPEDPEEKKKDFTTCLLEFLNEQKNEADNKAKEEENKLKEEQEKEREKLRQAYIREWDVGKEGVGTSKKEKFREMSQEEYVELQRSKRIDEFAPQQRIPKSNSAKYFDEKGNSIQTGTSNRQKTWSDVRPEVEMPLPTVEEETLRKGLFFSSSTKPETVVKYRNFVRAQEPELIHNELSDDESRVHRTESAKRGLAEHTEVAPPPTFEYYGPNVKYARSSVPFSSDLSEAYAQGARLLQKKEEKAKISQQYDFIL